MSPAPTTLPRPAARRGFTLVELMVVSVLVATLACLAVPLFERAVSQARVDEAAARLEALWTAQRLYWLQHGVYADSVDALARARLLARPEAGRGGLDLACTVTAADGAGFTAEAAPAAGSRWAGSLRIDEQGQVRGDLRASDGQVLAPAAAAVARPAAASAGVLP
jgi:prepilin-type N-terminal cleavage/methylation domain-containing protein